MEKVGQKPNKKTPNLIRCTFEVSPHTGSAMRLEDGQVFLPTYQLYVNMT